MLDPRHAALDPRMADLWRQKREWEIRLVSARGKDDRRRIRAEIRRIQAEILLRQDEPWPDALEITPRDLGDDQS